jgi:translation initiation factor IF-3
MDYGQWQYEQKKKQHEAKKKQHVIQVKELKFRPNTDDHDYDFKKKNAIRFLGEGNRVKAVVQFRGREIAHVDLGKQTASPLRQRPHRARHRRGPTPGSKAATPT